MKYRRRIKCLRKYERRELWILTVAAGARSSVTETVAFWVLVEVETTLFIAFGAKALISIPLFVAAIMISWYVLQEKK